jgi:uncharacterized membrane protein
MGYIYIFCTVVLTAYGQLILKWRLNQWGHIPEGHLEKIIFFAKSIFDPYIFSSFFSAFIASLTWMAALKEIELSKAYPFMNLSLILVVVVSFFVFHENVSFYKVVGCAFIVIGVFLVSKA